jgi:hypothetical protein
VRETLLLECDPYSWPAAGPDWGGDQHSTPYYAVRHRQYKLLIGDPGQMGIEDAVYCTGPPCPASHDNNASAAGSPKLIQASVQLFDLSVDMNESVNLAESMPELVANLTRLIELYNDTAVPPLQLTNGTDDLRASPVHHNGTICPWVLKSDDIGGSYTLGVEGGGAAAAAGGSGSAGVVSDRLRHSVLVEAAGTAGTLGGGVAWAGLAGGRFCEAAAPSPPEQLMAVGHAPATNGSRAATWVALFLGPTPHRMANTTINGSCDAVSIAAGMFAPASGRATAVILCSSPREPPRVLLVHAGAACTGPLQVSEQSADLPPIGSAQIAAGKFTSASDQLDQLLVLRTNGSLTLLELSDQMQQWETRGTAAVPAATHPDCRWTVLAAAPSFGDKTGALAACGPPQQGVPNVVTVALEAGDNRSIAVHQTNGAPASTPAAPEVFLDGAFLRGNTSADDVFVLLRAPNASFMNSLVQLSAATLQTTAVGSLLDRRHQSFRSLAAVSLGSVDSQQLVLSRTSDVTASSIALGGMKQKKRFAVDMLVFDSRRDVGRDLSGVRSTHGQVSWLSEYNTSSGHMTRPPFVIPELLSALRSTRSTMYQYIIWGTTNQSYLTFVELLEATRVTKIAGQPLQIWADLIPPSESPLHNHSTCSVPANSPLTDFDELSFFQEKDGMKVSTRVLNLYEYSEYSSTKSSPLIYSFVPKLNNNNFRRVLVRAFQACTEYLAWAEVLGRLAAEYPQLRLVGIDDFTVRALPGRLSALSVPQLFTMKIGFVWGFCMGAQGA